MTWALVSRWTRHVFVALCLAWTCALGYAVASGLIDAAQATTDKNVAVLDSQLGDVSRRISAMEDRLFSVLLISGGALISSLAAAITSLLIKRKVNQEEVKP